MHARGRAGQGDTDSDMEFWGRQLHAARAALRRAPVDPQAPARDGGDGSSELLEGMELERAGCRKAAPAADPTSLSFSYRAAAAQHPDFDLTDPEVPLPRPSTVPRVPDSAAAFVFISRVVCGIGASVVSCPGNCCCACTELRQTFVIVRRKNRHALCGPVQTSAGKVSGKCKEISTITASYAVYE